jgi:hypothetical protein
MMTQTGDRVTRYPYDRGQPQGRQGASLPPTVGGRTLIETVRYSQRSAAATWQRPFDRRQQSERIAGRLNIACQHTMRMATL